jgi:type VI secretion system protein ImpA
MGARWDGLALLEPISAEQPCGVNLENTPLLASFDAFRLFGQLTPFEPAPEWEHIKRQAGEALRTSKDLRLLAHLGAALLRTDGLPAFVETLKIAAEWLDAYWDTVYPLIDEDAVLRRSALNCLSDQMAVIDGLRRAPLVSDRQLGRFSLRDVEMAAGQVSAGDHETPPGETDIAAAFAAMPLEELTGLRQAVVDASAAVKNIEARMREQAGVESQPTLDALSGHLGKLDRVLRAQLAARPDATLLEEGGAAAATSAPGLGVVRSRQDAIQALDAVANFFRQTEPSSPLPLLLERAKRLVAKNFLDVLADLAPGSLDQARTAVGLKEGE